MALNNLLFNITAIKYNQIKINFHQNIVVKYKLIILYTSILDNLYLYLYIFHIFGVLGFWGFILNSK